MIDFKKICEPYKEIALKTLVENIKIDSVYDEKTISKDAPYGIGVRKCFDYLKDLALKDGFDIDTCDNRCLEISYGKGETLVGIFAHQDVVPVNGVWKHEPFGAEIEDEVLYGRGTSDDKGPGISAYYALKALKDNGLIKGYRVRLVFGGDEERGSSCLKYYFDDLKKEQPTYGFTPDGDFPLIYGEKGICDYEYRGNIILNENIMKIEAGTASNSVIDEAFVTLKNIDEMVSFLENHPEIKYEKVNENTLKIIGKPAHGSIPELGINAGIILLGALGEVYNEPVLTLLCNEYIQSDGTNIYSKYSSKNLGATTYNVGIINYENGMFKMVVNFRYPETVNSTEVVNKIQTYSPLPIYILKDNSYLYYDPETTPFIQTLARIYEEETGDKVNKMMTIGGGTYAKEAKNTVAFGSHFPGKEDHIHGADEKIDLEDFYGSMPLYARAIYELGNLKK